jgi:NTP pyrophosphatase (non-canonical NTP hydrolase)
METEDRIYYFRQAVKQWGEVPQLEMAVEEMSELTVEIMHLIRSRIKRDDDHLAEEIADVELCIEQLKDILDNWIGVEDWKNRKMLRLKKLLEVK